VKHVINARKITVNVYKHAYCVKIINVGKTTNVGKHDFVARRIMCLFWSSVCPCVRPDRDTLLAGYFDKVFDRHSPNLHQ